jgi:tRNA(Ile)-lysidine synthetase-like protein
MLQKHSRPSHGVADPSTMTAVSPYAPTARNQFLQRHGTPRFYSKGACLAIFLLLIKFWDAPQLKRVRTLLYTRISETACGQVVDHHHARLLWSIMYRMGETIMERIRGMAATRGAVQEEEQRMIWKSVHDVAQGGMERIQRIVFPLVAAHWYEQDAAVAPQGQVREESDAIPNVDFVRRNQQCIQSILHYWFGQYSPENSQKKLWMIASSSAELRERVDADITERFQHVITSLSQENGMWQEWCHDSELYGYTGKIAAILALDQFSRHLTRYYSLTEQHCTIPPQSQLDERAYKTAQLFTQQHEQEILCGMVPLPMYVFALMPYRHASTIASVQYVQECIDKTTNIQEQMDAMLRRFRSATNRRHAVLQDEARRTGATEERDNGGYVQQNFTDEDILEVFPFDADMSTAEKHIVYKTVASFLADRGIERKSTSNKTVPVIISLSGGVDSMVIASVLAHLRTDCGYNIQIVGIHIDYANRPESGAEAAYVQRYCERLGITYKCRTIDEVTRGVTARDDYERIAREARYDFYRKTVAEHMNGDADIEVGVMLGHHRGDLRENVLSNSHKGCGPLDLSGMTAVSKNDGVVIYRPLLPLEKRSIYDYAHSFGVPYFKDTTPHWSTRGKLRNKLLPLLQEIYGEGSMNNLSTLATESDEARELLQIAVLAPFLDQVERKPMGITFATKPWKAHGLFFWKFVLREALHSAGLGMFSEKSVISFLERIQADRVKPGWLQCRRDYAVYLQEKDGRSFVFFPESFPFRKSDQFDCVGQGK